MTMATLDLLQHLKSVYPSMDVHHENRNGYDIVVITDKDDEEIIDPVELEHRGIVGDYGFPGLTKVDAEWICEHNRAFIEDWM